MVEEKAMAPHSSTLAWKIPWTEEPGGLQSMGSPRVGHDWATSLSLFTFMHWRRKWQPTPALLPGESHGRRSLVGCHLWGRRVGHDWNDLAAAAAEIALWTGRGLMKSWGGWVLDKEQNSEWSGRMIQWALPRQSRGLIQAEEKNICWTGNQYSTLQRFLFSSVFVILHLVATGKLDKPIWLLVYIDNIYPVTILFKLIATGMWIVAE